MRVAVDLRSLMETSGKISGVENYLYNFLNALEQRKSFEILPFCNSSKPVHFPDALSINLQIKKTSMPNKFLNASLAVFSWPKFEKLYGEFEVLWMPDIRPFAILERTRLALTVHDLSPFMHPEFYSMKRRIWHRLIDYRRSLSRADVIFAVSEYTKYDLQKIFGIPTAKIKVVYPGIDHDRFHSRLDSEVKKQVAKKYSLPERFILSISTVEPRKNILGLIEAFENISDTETSLVIAGRLGWLYNQIIGRIANSKKKSQIKLVGYVDELDKPYVISCASLLCYPSFYEGFGFQPLEAMACGVPVITSARTSIPEICGGAALLVEPYNFGDLVYAIDAMLADKALRSTFIQKGFKRAAEFSWHKSAAELNGYITALA